VKADKEMECEHAKGKLTDWLSHRLNKADQMEVEKHLTECVTCQEEFAMDKQLWESLGKMRVPEPKESMRADFYQMLDQFKKAENAPSRFSWQTMIDWIRGLIIPQWAVQVAFSLLLVGLGWIIGLKTGSKNNKTAAYQDQIETLASQVQDMKSTMMLSLIENPSATERLRAVGYTSEIANADERVIEALFTTLNGDDNVNVRLLSLEALTQYADDPAVREGLVKSLLKQDSPVVQVELADVMVKLQEKRSIKTLKTLLKKADLNDFVKIKIEQSIKDLS
jgi:HEAT repeat protein